MTSTLPTSDVDQQATKVHEAHSWTRETVLEKLVDLHAAIGQDDLALKLDVLKQILPLLPEGAPAAGRGTEWGKAYREQQEKKRSGAK